MKLNRRMFRIKVPIGSLVKNGSNTAYGLWKINTKDYYSSQFDHMGEWRPSEIAIVLEIYKSTSLARKSLVNEEVYIKILTSSGIVGYVNSHSIEKIS